jgi:putative acetyltransferase
MTQLVSIRVDDPASSEARRLIKELDAYLESLYPAECNHLLPVEALRQPNVTFLTASVDGKTVGCAAYVNQGKEYAEIKRMYVMPEYRSLKIGRRLLQELESRAATEGLHLSRLETGVYQPEALRLYERAGYTRRGAFGSYRDDEPFSVFMEKRLK